MNTDRTEKLIARAIAALPYRKAPDGFSLRVMAGVEAAARADAWQAAAARAAGLVVAAWAALVGTVSAGPAYAFISGNAPLLAQPGGFGQALDLLGARAALLLVKMSASFSLISDLGYGLAAVMPPWHEVAIAALASAAVIGTVAGGRVAACRKV